MVGDPAADREELVMAGKSISLDDLGAQGGPWWETRWENITQESTFTEDNKKWQLPLRDKFLVPWYPKICERFELYSYDKNKQEQLGGIDTAFWTVDGRRKTADEKIVRAPHDKFTWELLGFPHYRFALEENGWMKHEGVDLLIFCFADHCIMPLVKALDVYFIDLPGLQRWFWDGKRRLAYETVTRENGRLCRLVNIDHVCNAVWTMRYQLPV